jgi:phosphate transport system ATP-binding protein
MKAIEVERLRLWYGDFEALQGVSIGMEERRITSLIGPSGCGKSTLLRCLNRMNERLGNVTHEGSVRILGEDIYGETVSLVELRKRVGMVFQRPNPLPLSVEENVAFPLRLHAELGRAEVKRTVERCLREVDLWDSAKDHLGRRATELSLEQQQKLCIARLLPLEPEVILMDEPCSALDVAGTRAVEDLMRRLRERYTIVIVTHNMAQAKRVSEDCVFMLLGEIVEAGPTERLFGQPVEERTAAYLAGRFG